MEGLSVADTDLVVYLHPSKSMKVSQEILRELSSLRFNFNETFDGVLLAFDVNILDKQANILSGVHPYFGFRLKANLLLFSAKPDMVLEGKVVKLSQESIHVIILGFSSAIITAENIRRDLKYKTAERRRVTICQQISQAACHKGWNHDPFFSQESLCLGSACFMLTNVLFFDEEILHIVGSLMPAHTGSIRWLDRNLEEISEFDRSATKNRDREWQEDKTVDEGATPLSYNNHIKK
ncbi:hypothetical protein CRYUN_Cryun27aG0105900 [Craigia yunnanensis]